MKDLEKLDSFVKKVLVINSSPMGEQSATNIVTQSFIEEYKKLNPVHVIKTIDLSKYMLPPFTAKRIQAKFATWGGKEEPEGSQEEWNFTKELIDEFMQADKYVFAIPMWNLGIPNQLKLFIDHIVQPWKTFDPTKMPGGFVVGKPALLISASGSDLLGTSFDFVTSYMKTILSFIGFTDIRSILISGTALKETSIISVTQALLEAKMISSNFTFNPKSKVELTNITIKERENKDLLPLGKRVLAIVSSPMGQFSVTTTLLNNFLIEYKKKEPEAVIHIVDIYQRKLPPITPERVIAKFKTWSGNEVVDYSWDYTKQLIDEFKWADTYVFAVPMWNFGIPNQLKLYFDHIVQPWKTFDPTKGEGGLVKGRACFLICSAGGPTLGSPFDYVTPYLTSILGYIGITDIRKICVNNTIIDKQNAINEGFKLTKLLLENAVVSNNQSIQENIDNNNNNNNSNEKLVIQEEKLTVLVITSSPMREHSASNKVVKEFIAEYSSKNPTHLIKIIDLATRNIPPFTAKRIQAKFAIWGGKEEPEGSLEDWNLTKELIDEFMQADKYVFAIPMWNLGIPNQLKRYIDHIVQPWKTFDPSKMPGGFVVGKPALLISASGSDILDSPLDFTTSYMKTILSFIGFTDIRSILISGTSNTSKSQVLITSAIEKAKEIAPIFSFNPNAKVDLPNNILPPPVDPLPIGRKVLVIVSSPLGKFSISTSVMNNFLEEYKRKVPDAVINIFDVFQRNLQPFTAERVQAKISTWNGNEVPPHFEESWEYTTELIDEFKWADTYVFAVPMWNSGIPNQLKLYFDHIVQPWKTFDPTKGEGGLVKGRACFLICSAGGPILGSPFDYVTPYLTSILGYIGITDIRKIWINNTASENFETLIETKSIEAIKLLEDSYSSFIPLSSLEKLLKYYEEALNNRNIDDLVSLYTEDSRLMINNFGDSDAIGLDQIKTYFTQFLQDKNDKIYIEIQDIVEYIGSANAVTLIKSPNRTTQSIPYRELFVFTKSDSDDWKILFHTTNIQFQSS